MDWGVGLNGSKTMVKFVYILLHELYPLRFLATNLFVVVLNDKNGFLGLLCLAYFPSKS